MTNFFSSGLLMLTVTICTCRFAYIRTIFCSSGNSSVQGAHQVAQKFTNKSLSVPTF
jgi:hypothetical protein